MQFQRELHECLKDFDATGWEWYRPNRWMPHCTLAITKEDDEDVFYKASDLIYTIDLEGLSLLVELLYEKQGLEKQDKMVEIEMRVSDMDGYKDIAFFHHLMIEKR